MANLVVCTAVQQKMIHNNARHRSHISESGSSHNSSLASAVSFTYPSNDKSFLHSFAFSMYINENIMLSVYSSVCSAVSYRWLWHHPKSACWRPADCLKTLTSKHSDALLITVQYVTFVSRVPYHVDCGVYKGSQMTTYTKVSIQSTEIGIVRGNTSVSGTNGHWSPASSHFGLVLQSCLLPSVNVHVPEIENRSRSLLKAQRYDTVSEA